MSDIREIISFAPGGVSYGSGMLGATGSTPEMAQAERLNEIERRILAIEAALVSPPSNNRGSEQ